MILDEIASKTRERINREKKLLSINEIRDQAESIAKSNKSDFPFYKALKKEGISFICEVKKASPSKGVIAEDFPYIQIAGEYEQAGARAISCLTEPYYFQGSDKYLKDITDRVSIPVLRKDFTIDSYMIYQAKVLLICSILDKNELKEYQEIAHELGLSALVEAHDESEIYMALDAGARIIGVNNRDLKTFTVDINNSARLRNLVPRDIAFVSESGIKTKSDIERLVANGTDAVLIGETLMRNPDKKKALDALRP